MISRSSREAMAQAQSSVSKLASWEWNSPICNLPIEMQPTGWHSDLAGTLLTWALPNCWTSLCPIRRGEISGGLPEECWHAQTAT